MFLRKFLNIFATVGKPLVRLLGIKGGTVADKAADAAVIIDSALPKDRPRGNDPQ